MARAIALVAALLAACACAASPALADGDPASDTLISQPVFFPYYVKLPPRDRDELTRVVTAAGKQGYPVRVALIAHDFDLGAITPLFRKPQPYAKFLAQELANFNTGWVLIAMPNGYGIYHCTPKRRKGGYSDPCEGGRPTGADRRLLGTLPLPAADGRDLAAAATVAVRRLARLHGADVDAAGDGGSRVPILAGAGGALLIVLAAAAVVVLRRRRSRPAAG